MSDPLSLQIIASKALGGAERWFMRFTAALAESGAPTELAIRRDSALDAPGSLPVHPHRLPFFTTWDPLSRRAVERLIARIQPAIVQTYMGRATRLTRLPSHGPVHLARLGGYYKLGPYRHAHGWIGNTKGLCDWMIGNGLPAQRVHHIYNFVEPARLLERARIETLRASLSIPNDAWILTTLGRLVPVKGQSDLIAALAQLPERIADRPLRLVMVGDGPLRERLQQQARQSGQTDRILWVGWQRDPAPWLQLADLIVFPSLDAETLGNVILEAWAWERPLVCTAFRGARELAHHGEDAWRAPCADPVALALGIRKTLEDSTLRSAMVARGRARIALEFSRDVILSQYRELYRRLSSA